MKMKELYFRVMKKVKEYISSDELRRRALFFVLNITLALTSLVMTVVNIFTGEHILCIVTAAFCAVCVVNLLLLSFRCLPDRGVYLLFALEVTPLLLFFLISGIPNGFSVLWICLIPSFAMPIFGKKKGSFFSLFAFLTLVVFFRTPFGRSLLHGNYTEEFMLRFPILYLSIFVTSFVLELIRSETQAQLEDSKRQYRYLYRHDALTGLHNRYGIEEYVHSVFPTKQGQRIAVILFDIDDFKGINDKYGHETGDAVLKAVGEIPPGIMCSHCKCCRWGGEEFLLLMQCDHDPIETADKIRTAIAKTPISYASEQVYVTASMGVAIAKNREGITFHEMVDRADKAMYLSKERGKDRTVICEMSESGDTNCA